MKQVKELSQRYFGLEAIIAALFYTVMLGTIEVGGLLITTTYLIVVYLVLKFFYRLEGRFSIAISIGFLGFAGILLVANDEAKASWAAMIAFIFLVIGILWQIAEMVVESREQAKALKENKGFGVSFWLNKQLVVATIFVVFVSIYSLKVNFRFQVFQQNQVKMKKANIELKRSLLKLKKKPFVKVLSGSGKLAEASGVVDVLRWEKIGIIEIGDSRKKDNIKTLVQYKDGNKKVAKKIAKLIADGYFVKVTENLAHESPFDVLIADGYSVKVTENLADKSPFDVVVILGKIKKD